MVLGTIKQEECQMKLHNSSYISRISKWGLHALVSKRFQQGWRSQHRVGRLIGYLLIPWMIGIKSNTIKHD
jgi:hypothetical protein